jgi:hypothetical protein
MLESIRYREKAIPGSYDEAAYLLANPDVAKAVESKAISSGYEHFRMVGYAECRWLAFPDRIQLAKTEKQRWLLERIKRDCIQEHSQTLVNCLTQALVESSGIVDTRAVSAHEYDERLVKILEEHPEWKILDAGAGLRNLYYPNIVNYEIVAYDTTDVLGVGEQLPFVDGAFDMVISNAVLEHVVDPFLCANELMRVLTPGGKIWCSVPFLQPYHGYPRHYFNMTFQGIERLFAKQCEVQLLETAFYFRPIFVFQELLGKYASMLPAEAKREFESLSVFDLITAIPHDIVASSWYSQFPEEFNSHYCSGNTVLAIKNS